MKVGERIIQSIFFILLLALSNELSAQCSYETDLDIVDLDTTQINIIVSGAENNDLATNNCLQAINLHFKHQFIGDITAELISPAGQVIQLLGPFATLSSNTQLVLGWNIQFLPSDIPAIPDAGYSVVWDNLQTWLGGNLYVGSYYPYQGNLEDFDTGSVNGVWTLNIIDHVQFGDGEFFNLQLTFCNSAGIDCATCTTATSELPDESFDYCEGDENLQLDLVPTFDVSIDTTNYDYGFAVYENDELLFINENSDFTTLESGNYSICGLYYFESDLSAINQSLVGLSKMEGESALIDNNICAQFSENCVDLLIKERPNVVTEVVTLCKGDSVVVGGTSYKETGLYEFVTPSSPCDSISYLDLTIIDLVVDLESEVDSISCDYPELNIFATDFILPSGAQSAWTTDQGNIVSINAEDSILVNLPGTYYLKVDIAQCSFVDSVILEEANDFVFAETTFNHINCQNDTILVDLFIDSPIDSVVWTGTGTFEVINENLRTGEAGIYTYTIYAKNGCVLSREVEILDTRVIPNITIEAETLTCINPLPTLSILMPQDEYDYEWYYNSQTISVEPIANVSSAGTYQVEVSGDSICTTIFDVEVISEINELNIDLLIDTLSCTKENSTITYVWDTTNLFPIWTLPNGTTLVDSVISTPQTGMFTLRVEDNDGCTKDTTFTISDDAEAPELSVFGGTLVCGVDSIIPTVNVNFTDVSYSWIGPGGFSSDLANPGLFSAGQYILEVCRPNGCCDADTIFVTADTELPDIVFQSENLDCNTDTVFITPNINEGFSFEWKLNNIPFSPPSDTILVTEAGFYEVLVTNPENGCSSFYFFNIKENFIDYLQDIDSGILNCENEEVQITPVSNQQIVEYSWSGPSLLNNDLSPLVDQAGQYIIDFTLGNGCSGIDTFDIVSEGIEPNMIGEDQVITCIDPSTTLSITHDAENISVTWTGPNASTYNGTSISVTTPGIYTAYGVAPGSCRDTLVLNVETDTIAPNLQLVVDGDITCSDSIVKVTSISNAEVVSFSGPGIVEEFPTSINVNLQGSYTANAIGLNGCETSESIQVTNSIDFPVYDKVIDSITCSRDTVFIGLENESDNVDISWDGPLPIPNNVRTFTTSIPGSYSFEITNEFDCVINDSIVVVLDTLPPNGQIDFSGNITCDRDTINFEVSDYKSSWDVEWLGPNDFSSNLPSFKSGTKGKYYLTLTGANDCISYDSVEVVVDTVSANIELIGEPITCMAGKTFLRINSDVDIAEYNWTGPNMFSSSVAEPLVFSEGLYTVVVITENGCITTDTISVIDERVFPDIIVDDFYLPCDEQPAVVTYTDLSDDATSRWVGENIFSISDTVLIFNPGEYVGIAINEDGCSKSDTFNVIDEPVKPIFSGYAEPLVCYGPSQLIAEDTEDDRNVEWFGPNGFMEEGAIVQNDVAGDYTLIVTGTNGCQDTLSISLMDERAFPEGNIIYEEPFQCNNTQIHLLVDSLNQEYNYSWSTIGGSIVSGQLTSSPLISGEGQYILNIFYQVNGCESQDTIDLVLEEQSIMDVDLNVVSPTCLGFANASISVENVIGGFGPYNFNLDGNDYGINDSINYLDVGDHYLVITDNLGCELDTTITISDENFITLELPDDITIDFGETINVNPVISGNNIIDSIFWIGNPPCDGCIDFEVTPFTNQTYILFAVDENNCTTSDTFSVHVQTLNSNNLPFPNIFSPNGDNINDVFFMPMTLGIEEIVFVRIYDSWGGLLFESNNHLPGDPSFGWNGKVNGQDAGQAVYLIQAEVRMIDGNSIIYHGSLTLIR